jgi:anti-anti-sigma factor
MRHHDCYQQFATVHETGSRGEVLHVFGDVDLSTVEQLNVAITEATADGERLLIDLSKCRYFDSSGLAALVRTRERLGRRLTVVVRPNTGVYRTLRLVGFDRIFNLVTELQTSCGIGADAAPGDLRQTRRGA